MVSWPRYIYIKWRVICIGTSSIGSLWSLFDCDIDNYPGFSGGGDTQMLAVVSDFKTLLPVIILGEACCFVIM